LTRQIAEKTTAGAPQPKFSGSFGAFASPLLLALASIVSVTLSGCGSAPLRESARVEAPQSAKAPTPMKRARGGGYYLDDGPGDSPPPDLERIPEPVPQIEPLHRGAMRPYVVMGQTYTPMTELTPYKARGVASWYGRRYHGKTTSTGEIYDMYGMSAAHPVLPLPSYVRVTNVATGKSLVVRVNDRGPFIDSRLIDLSYTAAHRLGVLADGSAVVEVEAIIPDGSTPGSAFASAPRRAPAAMTPSAPVAQSLASTSVSEPDPIAAIIATAREREAATPQASLQSYEQESTAVNSGAARVPATGIYLQLAAFGSRDNAETYLSRAKSQVEWIAQLLHLFTRDGIYRVHAGPYATASDARQAAERIALTLGVRPLVVMR
jgi:rare lipoprotein A